MIIKLYNNIKRQLVFNKLVKSSKFDLLNNVDYKINLEKINENFKSNIIPTPNDKIIHRIIISYKLAKVNQTKCSEAYQVGNEWLPIYKHFMSKIMRALESENFLEVKNIYENFMREGCSVGLHGLPIDMNVFFKGNISNFNKRQYAFDSIFMYETLKEITNNNFSLEDLKMPEFGNPYNFIVENNKIRTGAPYLFYYSKKINELLSNIDNKAVIELGGGYGGFAYFLNSQIKNLTYINVDLPENMALAAYYLLCSFPNKKILLYGEKDIQKVDYNDFDIILLPNFELKNIKTESMDLVFNSYSLAEMSKITIDTYIKELMRISRNYFMHVNHNKNSQSYTADNFGIKPEIFTQISKNKAPWGFGRNIKSDEFEYIYQKKNSLN